MRKGRYYRYYIATTVHHSIEKSLLQPILSRLKKKLGAHRVYQPTLQSFIISSDALASGDKLRQ